MGNPKVKGDSYYGKVAANYEKRRRQQAWWSVEQDEMEALLDTLPRGLKVLDVPFGTGRFVTAYIARGHEITGLDASYAMIAQGAEILGADFNHCTTRTGSAMDLPFADGAFDLLVSTRFLRDIISFHDARIALAEFARVTRRYAIIQLGQSLDGTSVQVAESAPMQSQLSAKAIDELLGSVGFTPTARRKVKSDPEANSEIFHILCEKTA